MWTQWGRERVGRIDSINSIYTIDAGGIAGEKLLCSTGSPFWCYLMTQREGGREGGRHL